MQIETPLEIGGVPNLNHFPVDFGEADEIVIGLVNIMPFSARQRTEREFRSLLETGTNQSKLRLRCFTLDDRWKRSPAQSKFLVGYESMGALWPSRLDGLIVTGAEPHAASIADEPLLPLLRRLISWASQNTSAAIFSCFAAHAAVWCMDGVARRRLNEKLSGVFFGTKTHDHPVIAHLPPSWLVPHSRHNTVDEECLEDAGYSILSQTPRLGADMFMKQHDKCQFLFLQGHPEYGPDVLLREYCRDLRRFFNSSDYQYPNWPENYLDDASRAAFTMLRQHARGGREPSQLADIELAAAQTLNHVWHGASVQIFTGWLESIIEHKARCGRLKT